MVLVPKGDCPRILNLVEAHQIQTSKNGAPGDIWEDECL